MSISDIFFRIIRVPFGQTIGHIVLQSQSRKHELRKLHTLFKLLVDLIWTRDQVRLRDCKLTYTGKSMHFPGVLISKQSRSLAVTQRQLSVAVLAGLVHIVLEWAGHRPQSIDLFIFLLIPKYKHSIFVMVPMSRNLIQVTLCHKWSLRTDISPLIIL